MELEKITAGQKDSQENGQAPAQAAAAQKYATAPAIAETSIARVPSLIASPSTRKYKTAITLQNTYDSSSIPYIRNAAAGRTTCRRRSTSSAPTCRICGPDTD